MIKIIVFAVVCGAVLFGLDYVIMRKRRKDIEEKLFDEFGKAVKKRLSEIHSTRKSVYTKFLRNPRLQLYGNNGSLGFHNNLYHNYEIQRIREMIEGEMNAKEKEEKVL